MKIKKLIKTECGLKQYYALKNKSENNLYYKMRLILYILIASIRDIFK